MTQLPLTTELALIILVAAVPVILPACLLWLALMHVGAGAATATFCAALVAVVERSTCQRQVARPDELRHGGVHSRLVSDDRGRE
jgi:hypothetical protein